MRIVRTLAVTSSPRAPSPRVAPRISTPVDVGQRDAQAVDLQLGDVGHGGVAHARALPDALVEGAQLVLVVGVVEAEHRRQVLDGREAFDRPSRDALRRRIGRDEIRMLGLEPLELVQQAVELLVGNLGVVVDVVALFVVADGVAELFQAFFGADHRVTAMETWPGVPTSAHPLRSRDST